MLEGESGEAEDALGSSLLMGVLPRPGKCGRKGARVALMQASTASGETLLPLPPLLSELAVLVSSA